MNDKQRNKCKTLYEQCQKSYDNTSNNYGFTVNVSGKSILAPSMFDDYFRVPEELLYSTVCGINKNWIGNRQNFSLELLTRLSDKVVFDEEWITGKKRTGRRVKQYFVYFEVFYFEDADRKTTTKPFHGILEIKNIKFSCCAKREYANIAEKYLVQEKKKEGNNLLKTVSNANELRRFPKIHNEQEGFVHPVKAEVAAYNSFDAAEKALAAFSIFANCFNVAQVKGRFRLRISGGGPRTTDSKTTMVDTGTYFIAENGEKIVHYNSGMFFNRLPKNYFDPSPDRHKLLNELLIAVTTENPVKERISNVVRDLATSYNVEDSGTRQLGFWRCLEHTTRKCGKTRKEKDIIDIFKNYREDLCWKQMGDIVLELRNGYVHVGKLLGEDEVQDNYINWAQEYAEASLNILLYLFKNRAKWNTTSAIDDFFDYYSRTDGSLGVAKMLLAARTRQRAS